MRAEPLGDAAYIIRDLTVPPHAYAKALNESSLDGLIEAVASYATVGVYVDPERFDPHSLETVSGASGSVPTRHRIPVCYELGEDTAEVCERLAIRVEELVELHTSCEYDCYAVGFCPGFAYLGHLPRPISGIPRRDAPRTAVPAGSVAITGTQTAVYPLERPGGWALIGRTPLTLVDVEERYFPIKAGDKVSFYSIDRGEFGQLEGRRL